MAELREERIVRIAVTGIGFDNPAQTIKGVLIHFGPVRSLFVLRCLLGEMLAIVRQDLANVIIACGNFYGEGIAHSVFVT